MAFHIVFEFDRNKIIGADSGLFSIHDFLGNLFFFAHNPPDPTPTKPVSLILLYRQ